MSGQTIAQLPYDVTDVTSLKRFLRELVDNLDIVLGYKGTKDGYVSVSEQADTIADIRNKIDSLTAESKTFDSALDDIKESIEALTRQVDLQNTLKTKPALGSDYYDFNATGWSKLAGRYTLSADGAVLLNTPFVKVNGTIYNIFIDSTETSTVVHQQITVNKTPAEIYTRWGVGTTWVKLG